MVLEAFEFIEKALRKNIERSLVNIIKAEVEKSILQETRPIQSPSMVVGDASTSTRKVNGDSLKAKIINMKEEDGVWTST